MNCSSCGIALQPHDRVKGSYHKREFTKLAREEQGSWKTVPATFWGAARALPAETESVQHFICAVYK